MYDPMLSLRNNTYTIVTRPPRSGCSTLSCKDWLCDVMKRQKS